MSRPDVPHGVASMQTADNRAIWQFEEESKIGTRFPRAEGAEFPGDPMAAPPAPRMDARDWDRFLMGGPSVMGSHPWAREIHAIYQFPSWEHAQRWLTEEAHDFQPGGAGPWLATNPHFQNGIDPLDARYFCCLTCGVWRPHVPGEMAA